MCLIYYKLYYKQDGQCGVVDNGSEGDIGEPSSNSS